MFMTVGLGMPGWGELLVLGIIGLVFLVVVGIVLFTCVKMLKAKS